MESAFGIDHGDFSKIDPNRVGFSDKAAYKRTKKESYKGSSIFTPGHGNAQRVAQAGAVGAGVGAALGGGVGAAVSHGHMKGVKLGAGIGALWGGSEGAGVGNRANMRHAGVRAARNAAIRGDLREAGPGERPSRFRRIIRSDN